MACARPKVRPLSSPTVTLLRSSQVLGRVFWRKPCLTSPCPALWSAELYLSGTEYTLLCPQKQHLRPVVLQTGMYLNRIRLHLRYIHEGRRGGRGHCTLHNH